MALRYYERKDGQVPKIIKKWDDADVFDQVTLQAEMDEDQAKLDLPVNIFDEMFYELSGGLGFGTPDEYRKFLQDRIDERKEFLDYYSYDKKNVTISIADGEWFTPIDIESVCGEEVGNEAIKMIDGDNGTWWQHDVDEQHEVIWELRTYPKKIEKIQIRRGSNSRSALTNLDIYVANSLGGLNNPNNLAVSGINLTLDASWNEIVFTKKQIGRYIKLTGFGSLHASNHARIREIQAWVTTMAVEF